MASQSVTLRELERRVRKVEQQVAAFTRGTPPSLRAKPQAGKKRPGVPASRAARRRHSQANSALGIAQRAGLLAELPHEARARVERWRALPEAEKKHVLDEFYNLRLDQPLSDLIIENRQSSLILYTP